RDPLLYWQMSRKLRQHLEELEKNHAVKIHFTSSSPSIPADHFRDKRIETANQLPSRFIIVLQGSLNQLSRVAISHVVVEILSTLLTMTEVDALRLQVSWPEADKH